MPLVARLKGLLSRPKTAAVTAEPLAAVAEDSVVGLPASEAGGIEFARLSVSGTEWVGHWPTGGEVEARFTVPGEWAREAQTMRRTDPKIRLYMRATTEPVLQLRYQVIPGAGPNAARNADYVRRAWGIGPEGTVRTCAKSWAEVIRLAWPHATGFAVLEPLLEYRAEDGLVWPRDIVDLEAASIIRFLRDCDGDLYCVTQQAHGTWGLLLGQINVPIDHLALFVSGQHGDNYVGEGALRAAWPWWVLKRDLPAYVGQAAERVAIPPLLVHYCREALKADGYTDAAIAMIKKQAVNQAKALRAGSSSVMVQLGSIGSEGLKYSQMQMSFSAVEFERILTMCDRQMAAAFAAQVIEIGTSTDTGSRASGEVHMEVLKGGIKGMADQILDVFNGRVRPGGGINARLLELNYGLQAPEDLPTITHEGLSASALRDALGALPALVAAGLLKPTPEVQAAVAHALEIQEETQSQDEVESGSKSATVEPGALEGVPTVGGGGRPEGT